MSSSGWALALLLAAGFGCSRTTTPQQTYVIETVDASVRLTEVGDRVGRVMEPWFHGERLDPIAIDDALADSTEIIESVREAIQAAPVPDDPISREYAALLKQYLDWQMEVLKDHARWAQTARAENPASVETRQAVIDELNALNERELDYKARVRRLARRLGVELAAETE